MRVVPTVRKEYVPTGEKQTFAQTNAPANLRLQPLHLPRELAARDARGGSLAPRVDELPSRRVELLREPPPALVRGAEVPRGEVELLREPSRLSLRVVPYKAMSGWSSKANGVHHADGVVWGPVYRTRLRLLRRLQRPLQLLVLHRGRDGVLVARQQVVPQRRELFVQPEALRALFAVLILPRLEPRLRLLHARLQVADFSLRRGERSPRARVRVPVLRPQQHELPPVPVLRVRDRGAQRVRLDSRVVAPSRVVASRLVQRAEFIRLRRRRRRRRVRLRALVLQLLDLLQESELFRPRL
eukprot:30894-Pelagococcus_subviridis.AAC.6